MNREIPIGALDAVIFDMDGVVTRTAGLHATAWKRLFDDYLLARALEGAHFDPFDIDADYRRYVDGKPRYDGVRDFLASRGVSLPFGDATDASDQETICGLGNRKDAYFWSLVKEKGVEAFASTTGFIRDLKRAGIRTGIFSASRNAEAILSAARVLDLFDEKVDGEDADELGIPGKPDPAMLLELTRRLGTSPERTAVVEDAIAGAQAGKSGGFQLVVGVNRSSTPGRLAEAGATIEVSDLSELVIRES